MTMNLISLFFNAVLIVLSERPNNFAASETDTLIKGMGDGALFSGISIMYNHIRHH